MSTPPTARPHDGERRKSLGKYVKRMSSVFKREKSSKDVTQSSSAAAAPKVEQQESHVDVPREEVAVTTQEAAQEPAKAESIRQEHPAEKPVAT